MQALWSRVGQAHHCGCKACSQAANVVLRRSTTATRRPKLTFGQMFTACYTSILGTAAVLDARKKDERRKALDMQLEQAREELARLRMRNDWSTEQLEWELMQTYANPDVAAERIKVLREKLEGTMSGDLLERRPRSERPTETRTWDTLDVLRHGTIVSNDIRSIVGAKERRAIYLKNMRLFYRNRRAKHERTDEGLIYQRIQRMIREGEEDPFAPWSPATPQELRRAEARIRELAAQLLTMVGANRDGGLDSPAFKDLRPLLDPQSSFPRFGANQNHRLPLNEALKRLFANAERSDAVRLVAKVCRNLLISEFPPNAHTYNILISGFDRLHLFKFSGAVVSSVLGLARLQRNGQTAVCLLNHYTQANDVFGFASLIARLVGRRLVSIESGGVRTDSSPRQARSGSLARQLDDFSITPTEMQSVLDYVIRGLTHFHFLAEAARVLHHCLHHSLHITAATVSFVFDACSRSLDPNAAGILLQLFANNMEKFSCWFQSLDSRQWRRIARRLWAIAVLWENGRSDACPAVSPASPAPARTNNCVNPIYTVTDSIFRGPIWRQIAGKVIGPHAAGGEAAETWRIKALRVYLAAEAGLVASERDLLTGHWILREVLRDRRSRSKLEKGGLVSPFHLLGFDDVRWSKTDVTLQRLRTKELRRISKTTEWTDPEESGQWQGTAIYRSGNLTKGWVAEITYDGIPTDLPNRDRSSSRLVSRSSELDPISSVRRWPQQQRRPSLPLPSLMVSHAPGEFGDIAEAAA